ncbi:hypothetical protein K4F52_010374, partial [Lecanicillium sp. MT-2017a]
MAGRTVCQLEAEVDELKDAIEDLERKISRRDKKISSRGQDIKLLLSEIRRLERQSTDDTRATMDKECEWRAAVDSLEAENARIKASLQEIRNTYISQTGELLSLKQRMTDSADMHSEFIQLKRTIQSICISKAYDHRKLSDEALAILFGGGSLS